MEGFRKPPILSNRSSECRGTTLPSDFPVPLIIVQHLPPLYLYQSQLCEILSRCSALRVKWIEHGEPLRRETVYLSPQDVQSRVTSKLTLDISDRVRASRSRPAADPLFSSVADVFAQDAIGIVLTGALSDGAKGAQRIADTGGRVFVQDEETALLFDMPHAAIPRGVADFALPPIGIAHALIAFTMVPGASAWFRVQRKVASVLGEAERPKALAQGYCSAAEIPYHRKLLD